MSTVLFGMQLDAAPASKLLLSSRAQGVVMTFYDYNDATPLIVFRADKLYTEHERKFFFRIGILPIAVFQGVTIEVLRPARLTNGLVHLEQWLAGMNLQRVELRGLSLVVRGEITNRLESGFAKVSTKGRWELSGGVRFRERDRETQEPQGTLQISGKESGNLVLGTIATRTNNLFSNVLKPIIRKETP